MEKSALKITSMDTVTGNPFLAEAGGYEDGHLGSFLFGMHCL